MPFAWLDSVESDEGFCHTWVPNLVLAASGSSRSYQLWKREQASNGLSESWVPQEACLLF